MKGQRAYFDANIFIYLMEGYETLADKLQDVRDSLLHRETECITSELTLCEVLVPCFRASNTELLRNYRSLIEDSGAFELKPTTREIYIRASQIRADVGLKTADAIHMATALEAGCSVFVTHDKKLKMPKSIKLLLLNEI